MSDATSTTPIATAEAEAATRTARVTWQWPNALRRHADVLRPPPYAGHQYLTVLVFLIATALIVPAVMSSRSAYFNTNLWLVYAITGIGFYWMLGLGGRFAFCQTFMMLLGAYTSAWVTRTLGDGAFLIGLAAAIAATALAAAVVGLVARKAQFFFFAIATMAVSEVGRQLLQMATDFTGPNGTVSNVSSPVVFGRELVKYEDLFWLFLVVLVLVLILAVFVERSPLRRDAVASRDNLLVARVTGVPATRIQLTLFVMGSGLGGLSGALLGHANGVVSLNTFGFDLAIGIFLMLYLGGVKSLWGPVVGAAFYVALPQVLSGIERYYLIVYGVLLLLVILALPDGIIGLVQKASGWVRGRWDRNRPGSARPAEVHPARADAPPEPPTEPPVGDPRPSGSTPGVADA